MSNPLLITLKFIFVDVIGDFLYWPIWWYSFGLRDRLVWFMEQVKTTWKLLAIDLWLKNFFVPMYGDRSILGRAISLVFRLLILVWKLIWFFIWVVVVMCVVFLWIAAPVVVVYMIYKHLN